MWKLAPDQTPRDYLAGAMTGKPMYNFPAFDDAAAKLRAAGDQVFNPAENDRRVFGFDPIKRPESCPPDLSEAIREDVRHMVDCTRMVLVPDWEGSMGVRRELLVARALGLPLYELQDGGAVPIGQKKADRLMAVYLGAYAPAKDEAGDRVAMKIKGENSAIRHLKDAVTCSSVRDGQYMAADPQTGAQKGQKRARFDLLPWWEVKQVLRRRAGLHYLWEPIESVQELVRWWERHDPTNENPLELAGATALVCMDGGDKGDAAEAKILWQLAEVYGANAKPLGKYEPRNWESGMAWSVLFTAAMRHGLAAVRGEELDADDGLPHMVHFLWHCIGLLFYARRGLGTDDRPGAPEAEEGVDAHAWSGWVQRYCPQCNTPLSCFNRFVLCHACAQRTRRDK